MRKWPGPTGWRTREVPSQAEVLGAVNEFMEPDDVVLCASGSAPGDLHKLWRTRNSKGFHLEYGYSCMGYEISGGLGAKMAVPRAGDLRDPGRRGLPDDAFRDHVTSLQEGYKLTIVLIDNQGFASIGGLSKSIGGEGFGTRYAYRNQASGQLDGDALPVDLASNAESLGAKVFRTSDAASFLQALRDARQEEEDHGDLRGHQPPKGRWPVTDMPGGTFPWRRCPTQPRCRRRVRITWNRKRNNAISSKASLLC
jgi:3D-(3,5/4)-trihydroxycyclohexane-1,2-dione acylhydrolase (decyclizing)